VQNGKPDDPRSIWTTAYVTRDHGYMIYDTLSRPTTAMPSSRRWSTPTKCSADKPSTWTSTLRGGRECTTDSRWTAEDCVASLKRCGRARPMGQKLMDLVDDLKASKEKTFVLN